MEKYFCGVVILFIWLISGCKPIYTVDLKIRNHTPYIVTIDYSNKDENKLLHKTLKPNEQFAISKYDREGIDFEWNDVWKFKIHQIKTQNNLLSWKDYNISGAWDSESSRYRTKAILILESSDFLAEIK